MFGPVAAALGELDDAAPADVRVAIGLCDLLAVARDVIEHHAFTQRQVAQRELLGAEAAHERVNQHRAGRGEVGAPRLESRHSHALLEIQ